MNIKEIQDKLLAYYAQGVVDEREVYEILGFAEWSDYHDFDIYNQIWTPEFRYRIYMITNPHTTLEQAFLRGHQTGWLSGFDKGYDAAIEDIEKGNIV